MAVSTISAKLAVRYGDYHGFMNWAEDESYVPTELITSVLSHYLEGKPLKDALFAWAKGSPGRSKYLQNCFDIQYLFGEMTMGDGSSGILLEDVPSSDKVIVRDEKAGQILCTPWKELETELVQRMVSVAIKPFVFGKPKVRIVAIKGETVDNSKRPRRAAASRNKNIETVGL